MIRYKIQISLYIKSYHEHKNINLYSFEIICIEIVLKESYNLEAVLKEHLQNTHQVKSRRNNDLFVYL